MLSSLLLKKNLALTLGTNKVDDLKTKLDHVQVECYKLRLINNLQIWYNRYIKVSKKHDRMSLMFCQRYFSI